MTVLHVTSFQNLSDLSDLLVIEDSLGFIEMLLLSIELCGLCRLKKTFKKSTHYINCLLTE